MNIKTHLNDTVKELIGQHSKVGNNRHATDITELLAITQRIGSLQEDQADRLINVTGCPAKTSWMQATQTWR